MGSHRRAPRAVDAGGCREDRPRLRRGVGVRRFLVAAVVLAGGAVAVLLAALPDAATDVADAAGAAPGPAVAQVAVPDPPPAAPARAPSREPAAPASPPGPLAGVWSGTLADPDTVTTRLVLTAGGGEPGVVAALPVLGCTYLGAAAPAAEAVTDLRASDDSGPRCLDTARVRLTPDPASGAVRYDVLEGCDPAGCAPRRAGGVLVPSRPGS